MNMDVNNVVSFRISYYTLIRLSGVIIDQMKSRSYFISCLTNDQHLQLSDFVVSKYCSKTMEVCLR